MVSVRPVIIHIISMPLFFNCHLHIKETVALAVVFSWMKLAPFSIIARKLTYFPLAGFNISLIKRKPFHSRSPGFDSTIF